MLSGLLQIIAVFMEYLFVTEFYLTTAQLEVKLITRKITRAAEIKLGVQENCI